MTYVVGIRDEGISAILCDSRVTFDRRPSLNSALKSGLLFPGCHYAAVGAVEPMRLFIGRLKTFLTGRDTPIGFWNSFLGFINGYDRFESAHPFTLLLMSRHTGRSTLYVFQSSTRSVTEQGDLVKLGSGKPLLDPVIDRLRAERHASIKADLAKQGAPAWFFGYYYCLALVEHAQGDAYASLNHLGVGGIFHFSYQTSTEEFRQHSAVYVIVSAFVEQKVISYTLYRVTFEEMALIVENGAEQSFSISIDEAAWLAAGRLDQAARIEIAERLQRGAMDQPFYNFLGLGFGSDALRQNWLTHLNLGANDYVLSRSAISNDAITHFAQGCITGELKANIAEALRNEPSN